MDAPAVLTEDETRVHRSLRYLLGTNDAYIKLRVQSGDPVLVELVSERAGDQASRKSQSSGHADADGCPLASCSRRQSCVATSTGMAEYYAMCSIAEELLHMRSVLEHLEFKVNTTPLSDSVAARGIPQRAGLGKRKALAVKTLWLQDIVRDRGLQIKSVSSTSAELWTKAPPVVRLNALRAACGIVIPGEPACEPIDEWGTDSLTTSGLAIV